MAIYELGPFRLDTQHDLLFHSGQPLAPGRRAVALLRTLVERRGTLVSKETLFDAAWPGQSVEESNMTVQIAALRRALSVAPGGDRWIETMPRRGYRYVGPVVTTQEDMLEPAPESATVPAAEAQRTGEGGQTLALPDKPSIAVLPFENLSGDPGQDYFADAMAEEIITDLSHVPSIFVVARNSTFTYKGSSPDVHRIARELGVRYVLQGSVRKADGRVRITATLIDATTGIHMWAGRFDGHLTDIFDLQDQVAARVVGTIEPRIRDAEVERARRKPATDLRAYDLVLRSRFGYDLDGDLQLLRQAVEIDPDYALALAMIAQANWASVVHHRTTPTEDELAGYVRMARDAFERAPNDPEVLIPVAPVIALAGGDLRGGTATIERACVLNRNSAEAWAVSGLLRAYAAELDIALEHLQRSRRLNPLDTSFQNLGLALAHFVSGNYDEVLNWTGDGFGRWSTTVPIMRYRAAALGLLGRYQEAAQVVGRLLALVPGLTVTRVRRHVEVEMKNPYKKTGVAEAYYEGLRRAGLPDVSRA
ncbi:MAG TPA: winged helix-turn-helix domain-containing tetratricopeptide repeat protein [Acetobacteraceae bacterium]|nr:winged helix-turn-helix domain-containing tetratricopeptide repeat protein [Acetobacteraceae bacterium]